MDIYIYKGDQLSSCRSHWLTVTHSKFFHQRLPILAASSAHHAFFAYPSTHKIFTAHWPQLQRALCFFSCHQFRSNSHCSCCSTVAFRCLHARPPLDVRAWPSEWAWNCTPPSPFVPFGSCSLALWHPCEKRVARSRASSFGSLSARMCTR